MIRAAAAGAWLAAGGLGATGGGGAAGRVTARVLGVAQDGGVPHLGCERACCVRARADASRRRRVASLGLAVEPGGPLFIVDATPDFPSQVAELRRRSGDPPSRGMPVDGILLTHAHIGHYTGLIHLGREVASARGVPVHATPRMCAFLEANKPWSRLVEWGHIRLIPLEPGEARELVPELRVEAIRVPHRDEDSDTVAFRFRGPERSLLYLPDTDSWARWESPVTSLLEETDVALLDATFFDAGELPWRDPSEVPHPTIRQSMDLFEGRPAAGRCRILFTHLNHSNPALDPDGPEAREIRRRGFQVASEGMEIPL